MGIKIIRTSTWNRLQAELENLRGAHLNLHELHRGLYQKYQTEKNELGDALKRREQEIEELKKKLGKSDHDLKVALKKLRMYDNTETQSA